jgi:single-strand DNA-binding protein
MANGLNKVMLIGNLGKDPEFRYTPNGKAVTTFSLAVNRTVRGADGDRHEAPEWVRIVTWEKLAETAGTYLHVGSKVYVEGRLQTRSWDSDDGQKHYLTEVIAQELLLLDARPGGNGVHAAVTEDSGDSLGF